MRRPLSSLVSPAAVTGASDMVGDPLSGEGLALLREKGHTLFGCRHPIRRGVTTLNPSDNATVSVSFDGTNVHFSFGIPQGAQGIQGYQGPPGEVTTSQLDTAIATTALNPTSVSPLNISFSDPPTASELVQVQDKLNELLSALQRVP